MTFVENKFVLNRTLDSTVKICIKPECMYTIRCFLIKLKFVFLNLAYVHIRTD